MSLFRVDQKDLYLPTKEFGVCFKVNKFTIHAGFFQRPSRIKGRIQKAERLPREDGLNGIYRDGDLILLILLAQHVTLQTRYSTFRFHAVLLPVGCKTTLLETGRKLRQDLYRREKGQQCQTCLSAGRISTTRI